MKKILTLSIAALTGIAAMAGDVSSPRQVRNVYGMQPTQRVAAPLKAPREANAADFEGRKFTAALINRASWADMSITAVPYGLYEYTIGADGVSSEAKCSFMSADWMGGAFYRNNFYGIRNINMFGSLTGVVTEVIDTGTWTMTAQVFADTPSYALLPVGMTYDVITGKVYGIFYNDNLSGLNLVQYNAKTLVPEIINGVSGKVMFLAIAASTDGNLYMISADGDLYTINRRTARVSLVGPTGVNVASYSQSMTWDTNTNSLLWAAITPNRSALYSVNPETGEATLVKKLDDFDQIVAMRIDDATAAPGCPSAPTTPAWNFSSPGADNGTITLSVAAAGNLSVYLDGEAVKDEEAVTAGQNVTVSFDNLSNDMHHVSAIVKNDKGYSPAAESFQYVGLDVPLAVTDLQFTETDGVANVSWTAPAGGVDGGYIDPSKLYYKIVRVPDNVVVAEKCTDTKFSETLPLGVKRYAYRVTPYNGAGKEGASTLSNSIIYGEAFDVPYSDRFDEEGALDIYTVIDGDGDGTAGGWSLLAGSLLGQDANDWIISPKINFEQGKLYRVTIHARNMWAGKPENIQVGYIPEGDLTVDRITTVGTIKVDTPSLTMEDLSADFSLPADGRYHIALAVKEPCNGGVFIRPLKVDLIGMTTAPAAPTDLTVTPDASRELKAEISFTAPSQAIDGTTLSAPLTANIYRDGASTPTLTVSNVAPGTSVSATDATVTEPGYHTYVVRLSNGSGEGVPVEATEFIGIFSAPYTNMLSTNEEVGYLSYVTNGFSVDPKNPEMTSAAFRNEPCMEIYHVNFNTGHHTAIAVLPLMRFDDETVYRLSYDIANQSYGDCKGLSVVIGDMLRPTKLKTKCFAHDFDPGMDFNAHDGLIVVGEGGDKYVGFRFDDISNGYLDVFLKNVSLVYEASAKAPFEVTDLNASSDLSSKITMKAPAVDYAGRALTSLTKIEIYRNGSAMPVYTFQNPTPGDDLSWTDENALLGYNTYDIVPYNEHGRGYAKSIRSYIGFDEPVAPAGVSIVPTSDNQQATISWEKPRRGVNGGVLDEDNMTFNIVSVNPNAGAGENAYTIIKKDLTETSYLIPREATEKQEMLYYGVQTVVPQGTSDASIYFTILGRPYTTPFTESFVNGAAESQNWITTGSAENGYFAGPTTPAILEYNGYAGYTAADDDNGVMMFYNGAQIEMPTTVGLLSPKISLEGCTAPNVSFWLYKGNQSGAYVTVPVFSAYVSNDETNFETLCQTEWNETTPGWKRYVFSLDNYVGKPGALIFQFVTTTGGYNDVILMDKFEVGDQVGLTDISTDVTDCEAFGLKGGILTRGALGSSVMVYNPSGMLIATWTADDTMHAVAPGIYLVRIGSRTFKVVV